MGNTFPGKPHQLLNVEEMLLSLGVVFGRVREHVSVYKYTLY